jgi:hypothetical protein
LAAAELQIGDLLEQSKALSVTPQDNRRDCGLEVGAKNQRTVAFPADKPSFLFGDTQMSGPKPMHKSHDWNIGQPFVGGLD